MRVQQILAEEAEAGERLDSFLAQRLDISRSAAAALVENGAVRFENRVLKKNYRIVAGEEYRVELTEPRQLTLTPQAIALDIVYEDEDLLVVNKAQGMVVHPAAGNWEGTLVNALLAHCGDSLSGINGVHRPGIVHRLDKDTSGLMVVAKTDRAHQGLAEQIKEHAVQRIYQAVVIGHLRDAEGTVDAPIGRHANDRKRMCVTQKNAKEAVTHYATLSEYPGYAYIQCRLETGRTHQIRVHMAYLGHPVVGDPVYGPKTNAFGLHGQCLHSKSIAFLHPVSGESMFFESELPEYFQRVLTALSKELL